MDQLSNPPTTITTEAALQSQDMVEKLNLLIEKQPTNRSLLPTIWPMLVAYVAALVAMPLRKKLARPIAYLYPSRVFLLGKELERYTKKESLRHNILWGIVISSIVGIIAGLFVWLITK